MDLTEEQKIAIECEGKTIVSASAGSGKTFVMIQKIISAIERGVDLENVLAVTFTKKAAAQMKDKLRRGIIDRLKTAEGEIRERLKLQLTKVAAANISTIHAFAAKLLRTYFYAAGVDGGFAIAASDDAEAKRIKKRAMENLFDRYYETDDKNFKLLLSYFVRKRDDSHLQALIYSSYEKLRIHARYIELLDRTCKIYTESGFDEVCRELQGIMSKKYRALYNEVLAFASEFDSPREEYKKIFADMLITIDGAANSDIFTPRARLTSLRKPSCKTDAEKEEGERFSAFRERVADRYKDIYGDIGTREYESENFLKSGETVSAFAAVLKDFDREYSSEKSDANVLDYNDLEHKTLELLQNESVLKEITSTYSYVFVDEYQDVNPVQEEIISRVGGKNLFLVGDVKQAIYGFRGSKSLYFAEKYSSFKGEGSALKLSSNFRSCGEVVSFVNSLFSEIMRDDTCGIDYAKTGLMRAGGAYPEGSGKAEFAVFGKDEREQEELGVYSVLESSGVKAKHTREALAVLSIVERVLKGKRFDLKLGKDVDIQAGDICILTRKKNDAAAEIARALTDAGYTVAGAQDSDICSRPEIRRIIDILSYIDNEMQDIPLTTCLLSPLGGLTCDELSKIRIADNSTGTSFRECCKKYSERMNDDISVKLKAFYEKAEHMRDLSEILTAAEIIDKLLEETGLEGVYSSGGGEKLKNIRKLSKDAGKLSVSEFLARLKDGDFNISAPSAAASDSIKIMTMHASKGLEFPIVIIADICATFKGRDERELPFDSEYGFAPKVYDTETHETRGTILRRVLSERSTAEELANEYNLYYVACTRAMNELYVLAREIPEPSPFNPSAYAEFADISRYKTEAIEPRPDFERESGVKLLAAGDYELVKNISEKFMVGYAYEDSVNLPVKSSASAILKLGEDELRPHELFPSEYDGETNAERGTAYHRFLELCDFSKKSGEEIAGEIESFVTRGDMTARQRELIDIKELCEILSMPVFAEIGKAELYREQEFLCRLPANEVLPKTTAEDFVLLQGAIDLLAVCGDEIKIIDYKFSGKTDEGLKATYARQIELYKKAAAVIFDKDPQDISGCIVNIYRRRYIAM